MLSKEELSNIKRMAAEAIEGVKEHGNISISTLNYGLYPSKEILKKLAKLTGLEITTGGFLGYVEFTKKS